MMGFGAVNLQTLITGDNWPTSLVVNTLIANAAQPTFSVLYFAYNGLFTCMTLRTEWSQYAVSLKGLRVSNPPQGSQRSTYFLSLPYRYAVPLLAISATLHWIISQSIFLVGVEAYDSQYQRKPSKDFITCGYSPVAIMAGIIAGCLMLLYIIGMGFRRFKSGMPIASSCSAAISAACHPADDCAWEPNAARLPLQSGVIPSEKGVAHCGFSSRDVEMPEDGHFYQ